MSVEPQKKWIYFFKFCVLDLMFVKQCCRTVDAVAPRSTVSLEFLTGMEAYWQQNYWVSTLSGNHV